MSCFSAVLVTGFDFSIHPALRSVRSEAKREPRISGLFASPAFFLRLRAPFPSKTSLGTQPAGMEKKGVFPALPLLG